MKRGVRHLWARITVPTAVRPLPGREAGRQLCDARVGPQAKAAAHEEGSAVLRGMLPVAARYPRRLAPRVVQPGQNLIHGSQDSIIRFGDAELNQANQPPMSTLPLLVRMAGVFA